MRQVSTTSIDVGHGSRNRRAESDTDSAISVGADRMDMEKQLLPSTRASSPLDHEWEDNRTPKKFSSHLKTGALSLLPSFLAKGPQKTSMSTRRTNRITALDGLRGIVSLLILNESFTANFDRSFLSTPAAERPSPIIQWPIIRVLWSSLTMTAICFTISGYAISYHVLQQIHKGNTAFAHRTLASSATRRIFRLYLPTIIAVILCGLFSWIGLFEAGRLTYWGNNNAWGLYERPPPRFDPFVKQMQTTLNHAFRLLNFWTAQEGYLHSGDFISQTWIIPVIFRNSIYLFMTLLAVSRLRTPFRLSSQLFTIAFAAVTKNRSMMLFLSGMLLADLDLVRRSRTRFVSFSNNSPLRTSFALKAVSPHSVIYPCLFALGLFICSVPATGAEKDPQFQKLINIIPASIGQQRAEWLRAPGAIMIVWSAANSAYLSPIFTNAASIYLGKIAFSLYLVHSSVIRMALYPLVSRVYGLVGSGTKNDQTSAQLVMTWAISALTVVPLIVWVADVFWRAVDVPCTKLAKKIEVAFCEADEDGKPCTSPKRW